MKQLKNVGTAVLDRWVRIAGKIEAIPARTFYSFLLTALLFLLTKEIWNPAISYHWSLAPVTGSFFVAVWFSAVLLMREQNRELWRRAMVSQWIVTLFFLGMSMAIANSQRTIIDPLDDGLDTLVAIILGIVIMTISLFVIANLAVSKSKPNGNPMT